MPAYAETLPATLGGNFAILSDGSVTFTGNGSISGTVTVGVGAVEYLAIGGGGGGAINLGGGGGAGGFLTGMASALPGSTNVSIGAGGTPGGDGGLSQFGSIQALGGGGGATLNNAGRAGASGGGGGAGASGLGGTGTQGNNGGNASPLGGGTRSSGGGGGAGGAGAVGAIGTTLGGGSAGGAGLMSSITGTALGYAGGGGGGRDESEASAASHGGGAGGWGQLSIPNARGGSPGDANTGGGGGGGARNNGPGGNGGSGVVHIRYAGNGSVASGGTTTGPIGGTPYTLHSYTASGASTFGLDTGFDAAAQHAVFSGNLSGTGGLTKTAPGTLELSGTNTYEGATFVSAGTLLVNGSLGNSAVTVNGGTFGGTGTISSTVNFDSGSFHVVNLLDALEVTGTIAFGGGFGIANILGIDWDSVGLGPHTLISTAQTFGTGDINNFGFDERVAVGTLGREAYFTTGSLAVTIIPEPSAALLGGLGALFLLRRRRN